MIRVFFFVSRRDGVGSVGDGILERSEGRTLVIFFLSERGVSESAGHDIVERTKGFSVHRKQNATAVTCRHF